jgi:hypothetical protein
MLAEIEDKIADIIREKIADIPRENVAINAKPNKLPSVVISCLKFKFRGSDLSENFDEGKIEFEENFDSDGVKKSFALQEKPLKKSVSVESPSNVILTEKNDYTINYDKVSIDLKKAPPKGKRSVIIRYASEKNVMTLKSIKLKAQYVIDISETDRVQADILAEKVVTALLIAQDQLLTDGIELKLVGGMTLSGESGKTAKIQLKFIAEKEIRVKKIVGPIERIEIKGRNF